MVGGLSRVANEVESFGDAFNSFSGWDRTREGLVNGNKEGVSWTSDLPPFYMPVVMRVGNRFSSSSIAGWGRRSGNYNIWGADDVPAAI